MPGIHQLVDDMLDPYVSSAIYTLTVHFIKAEIVAKIYAPFVKRGTGTPEAGITYRRTCIERWQE